MKSWSVKMADSIMKRNPIVKDVWAYEHGIIFKGIELVWKKTGDVKYLDYIKRNMDVFVDQEGSIRKYLINEYNIDFLNNGKVLLTLYKENGDERYKKAASLLRKQIDNHPRTSEGIFWHKKIYPYQVWLDGLYMGAPFYAQYIKEFGVSSEFDDVTKQFLISYKHTKDTKTGLLYHAWDETKEIFWCNKETGLSKNFWGRSMGWFVMAIVDVLDYIPEDHRDRKRIIQILNETLEALLNVQDEKTGLWYQVLDQGDRKGNYLEASASCMILYAMAKGVRLGYLTQSWPEIARKTYQGVINEFVTITGEGMVNLNKICAVAGLGGKSMRDGTFEYYINEPIVTNDGKGVGAFILASAEMEDL